MKIIDTAEGKAIKVTDEELLNIWASILCCLAHHKNQEMPITRQMAKELTSYFDSPF